MDWMLVAQSVISVLVITAPPDPAKLIFFNMVVEQRALDRTKAAAKVATVVLLVLGGSALVGAQVAALLGIDLNAFGVVGGIIVAGMGFEMLYGGLPSRAQGQDQSTSGPDEDSGLIMPIAIPLIAGPGAIVTVVTMSTSNQGNGLIPALISVGVVSAACFLSFKFLGGMLAKVPASATALLTRIGGLLLATIGTQMLLGGLKRYFE